MQYFIVNPNARSKKGYEIWKEIKKWLDEEGIEYRACASRAEGEATILARELTETKRPVKLIVLGGDGTLNEVLNGICYPELVTLGYVPIGSSNDFARSMGIRKEPLELVKQYLQHEKTIHLDYGIVKAGNTSRRFIVSAGIGYDAAICYEANRSRLKKILNSFGIGKLIYAAIGMKMLAATPLVDVTYTLDDGTTFIKKDMILTAAFVQKYEGGGLMFCPEAKSDDGLLDVCIGSGIKKWRVPYLLLLIFKGKHVHKKGITLLRCRSMHVKFDERFYIHTDGESYMDEEELFFGEAEFMAAEGSIRFLSCAGEE